MENMDLGFQGIALPAVLLGTDLKVRRFSAKAERTLNIVSSDINKSITEINLSIQAPDLDKLVQCVIHTGDVYEREIRDKKGRWYSMRIRPYKENGVINGTVIVLVDIDDIKTKSEEFKEERDYSNAIIDTLREPFLILRRDLTVESANRSFYHIFECSPEETLGKPFYQVCCNTPEMRRALEEILTQHDSIRNLEIKHLFPRLGNKILLINARKVYRPGNNTDFIFLGIEDITEKKEIEQERQRVLAALEQFASTAAHDLRAPLRKTITFGKRLQEDVHGAGRENLAKMLESAHRMSDLMEELLNFSRVGAQVELLAPVDLNEVVKTVLSDLDMAVKESQADVKAAALPTVKAESTQMYQLFQNLIGNALKYRNKDRALRIEISSVKLPGGFSHITVKDNGIGFNQDQALEIFKPFRRLHGQSEYAGSGLGLALCEKIVKRYGGEIRAISSQGQGSSFLIRLPSLS
jgi:two-component system, chemotaxis family, CheB/CheR fusion protein